MLRAFRACVCVHCSKAAGLRFLNYITNGLLKKEKRRVFRIPPSTRSLVLPPGLCSTRRTRKRSKFLRLCRSTSTVLGKRAEELYFAFVFTRQKKDQIKFCTAGGVGRVASRKVLVKTE